MRRIILLSTPPNRHEVRQRRHSKNETPQPTLHKTRSGTKEARRRTPIYSFTKAVGKARSLTRTRSESDLIRAIAKHKEDENRKLGSDNDSDSENSLEEDDSRRATSLRSFTKEDEERYARSFRESFAHPGELCSKIGEEDEVSSVPEPDTKEANTISDSMRDSATFTEVQSIVSPVTESNDSQQTSETQSSAIPTKSTKMNIKSEYAKTSIGSRSGDSTTETLVDSEVDVEYLLHENELLKSSLDDVALQRDSLARDNWNLKVELENMRNQMRMMMSVSGSPPMYTSDSPPMYTTGQYYHYNGMYSLNQDHDERSCCTSQTFEELLGEN
mmetsp:Transcript_17469/g.33190  ORF Transcript_17469/g.33190 Transcript_17469/m.33190 type:complete len:330 (+) Transcript_17469:360-1349(+)|eukprot:scaffold1211_cov169-Amphora_coffeaeformis.AAC.29